MQSFVRGPQRTNCFHTQPLQCWSNFILTFKLDWPSTSGKFIATMLNPWCLTKSHSLISSFEHSKINIKLMIYEIFIVLLNIVYFPFFSVQTSKTVFHWIIVQDDKNSISSCEPNFFVKLSQECVYWSICY